MATYNPSANVVADVIGGATSLTEHHQQQQQQHYHEQLQRTAAATSTYLAPSQASTLQLETTAFVTAGGPHFVSTTNTPIAHTAQHHIQPSTANAAATSNYTFVQIKREPCQVSEVTTSNNCHQQQHQLQQHHISSTTSAATLSSSTSSSSSACTSAALSSSITTSKIMSSSSTTSASTATLTTLVKIEASSPKVQEMDKCPSMAASNLAVSASGSSATVASTNNSVPIGIAVARKRPQESSASTLSNSATLPMQQSLNKDMNCFGIRVADLGGVGTGCGNIYFTGSSDLMTGTTTSEEIALGAAGIQSVNRTPSTFWQYPNAVPIESVISMSPATVGLQYSREASRGQVVLLPATAAALGISNFPLYTPTDPFQQAAAAFVWPSYIPQGNAGPAAAAAAAALQPPPNFIFPSMSPHSTLQAQPYATSLQLFGSNYLTAAAAAAAAAAATSTLCQHNQQSNSSTSSVNLSLGPGPSLNTGGLVATSATCSSSSSTSINCNGSSSSSSRFLSMAATSVATADLQQKHHHKQITGSLTLPPPLPLPMSLQPPSLPLIMPPTGLKIEEWNGTTEFMSTSKTTNTTITAANTNGTFGNVAQSMPMPLTMTLPPVPHGALNFEMRDKNAASNTTTTNLLELQTGNAQALNLIRLPTPPTSATIETAAVAAETAVPQPLQHPQILFQASSSTPGTPSLLNLSANIPRAASAAASTNFLNNGNNANGQAQQIGPPTPHGDECALDFKTAPTTITAVSLETQQQIVVGVPRVVMPNQHSNGPQPQMQDVNIQTDTPVCSEDENSSCPLAAQQQLPMNNCIGSTTEMLYAYSDDAQQPLELTKTHNICNEGDSGVQMDHLEGDQPQQETQNVEYQKQTMGLNECANNNEKEVVSVNGVSVAISPQSTTVATVEPMVTTARNTAEVASTPSEDLTGLELLSNISTSTLAAKGVSSINLVRVKQEPLDHSEIYNSQNGDIQMNEDEMPQNTTHDFISKMNGTISTTTMHNQQTPVVEPGLGGLNLLCALAEQRIQEEVQQSNIGGGNSLFGASSEAHDRDQVLQERKTPHLPIFPFHQQPSSTPVPPVLTSTPNPSALAPSSFLLDQTFPSMEDIELPTTSSNALAESSMMSSMLAPTKRKKHKHSKSSKQQFSSSILSNLSSTSMLMATPTSTCKKSQRNKKSKKKYSKEKRKHKLQSNRNGDENEYDDEQLQEDIKSAFNCVDPSFKPFGGKWPNSQEVFSMMESNMRQRLADISRQLRKKQRKLDEISKSSKKKKKCSKLAAQQQALLSAAAAMSAGTVATPSLTLAAPALSLAAASSSSCNGNNSNSTPTSALCDYKFSQFSKTPSSVTSAMSSSTSTLLNPSFLSFAADKSKFPPPDVDMQLSHINNNNTINGVDMLKSSLSNLSTSNSSNAILKPVRLEPSSLSSATGVITDHRGSTLMRAGHKHSSSDKSSHVVCKERKLLSSSNSSVSTSSRNTSSDDLAAVAANSQRKPNPIDRELMLTSEHLYRRETRVLTDMGGLFYAGIMRPLQPPDIYAITLDGERGNKPHIMSREEIFKDTILEYAPKSIESVPVGTRLCAYWSQQYRCLYPGRVIEAESSDDDFTPDDFVSVEFDDGDSGRIRLQNIRLLLSDYPIAEYNDNPLYSLGKQKKSSLKSGNAPESSQQNDFYVTAIKDQQQLLAAKGINGHNIITNGSSSKLQNDSFMQRSEKKRLKSLKKKSQAAAVNGMANAGANAASSTNGNAVGATDDCGRKHHKHKKHKKHKKHHHRKSNNEAAYEENGGLFRLSTSTTETAFVSKRESVAMNEEQPEIEEEDEEMLDEHNDENIVEEHEYAQKMNGVHNKEAELIKVEANVKVKTELVEDMEEESTSNMMSEYSDEVKGDEDDDDEVEHNNSKGSKIAAFLPDRQLWGWLGKAYRKAGQKGRARKQFFKTIKRGKETISVGDCAVFLSTGRPDRPYIGRIESMWETSSSNKIVRVRWFYHPEETTGCPNLRYPGALFESPHEDENDVQTISHRCEVHQFERYFAKFGTDSKQYQSIYDNNDTYYLAGYYNPRLQVLKLQDDIPTLEEQTIHLNTEN